MKYLVIILIFTNLTTIKAQNADTVKLEKRHEFSMFILPAGLITYGIGARTLKPVRKLDHRVAGYVASNVRKKIPIDDYTEFVPVMAVFGLDMAGIKAKNNFRDRAIVSATSYMLTFTAIRTAKYFTNVQRPNSLNNSSFPSGHTAVAFTGAHLLYKEYKDTSPWIAVAGYTVAAGTGFLRVYNDHHWLSDVVTGAGVGILNVETGYLLLPVFHKMFGIGKNSNNIVVAPSAGSGYYGINIACSF